MKRPKRKRPTKKRATRKRAARPVKSERQRRLNARARRAGFRNDYEYRKASRKLKRRPEFPNTARGATARAQFYAWLDGRFSPGRRGSKQRRRWFGWMAEMLYDAGEDPSVEFDAGYKEKAK